MVTDPPYMAPTLALKRMRAQIDVGSDALGAA